MIDSHVLFERIEFLLQMKGFRLNHYPGAHSVLAPNPILLFQEKNTNMNILFFKRRFMWFKNEVGRDPVFCDISGFK